MRTLCLAALCIFFMICTPSMSMTSRAHMQNFASELNEVLTPAFAAYKMATYLNNTGFKPDGQKCWICTLLISTMEKYTLIKNVTVDDFIMKDICPKFPVTYRPLCQQIVELYGPTIIHTLIETESADAACAAVGYCDQKQCKLFPKGTEPKVSFSPDWAKYFEIQQTASKLQPPSGKWLDELYTRIMLETISNHENSTLGAWVETLEAVGEDPLDWLKELINKIATNHSAIVDLDNDYFSETSSELRGYNWRGRDCNDNDALIYPGRKTNPKPGFFDDYNCNGIAGVDTTNNQSYKDTFCANSGQIGVLVMGDSAGAHCEVPSQWVNASMWDDYSFDDLIQSLADEIDLPHMSAYTGYVDEGYHGPANSFYKYLYQRNKCNFRDYQNIAVNGLSSRNAQDAIIRMARNPQDDYPIIAFLELIGNDVCGSEETYDHWTTVDEFRTNLIGILDTIDPLLPPGSHLVALGLANGSLIFEGVNGRMHPAGITYNQFYDFLNCLNASLCWGWLNTNQTIRDATSQRAAELSAVYSEVFSNYTAKNFDTQYYDFPAEQIWNNWTQAGNDPYFLIEPVDGFHPSQIFNSMLGDFLWESISRDHPEWIGPENPNNDEITKLFGDQGGY